MEHRQSPLDNENERRQNSAEKPSDASPSERLQKSRNSHLIGSGINPHEWSNRQVGTNEAASSRVDKQDTTHHDTQNSLEHDTDRDPRQDENRLAERETGEKQAITTPLDGDLDHSNTQGRNEKRQLSALEEALEEKWSQSISLDEYGHRLSKIFELTSIPTRDNPILVGGANGFLQWIGFRNPERGGPSHGDQRSEAGDQRSEVEKWIGQTLKEYRLVEYLREAEDRYGHMRLFYRGEHVDSKEKLEVDVPKGAGEWIGQTLGSYKLVDYKGEGGFAYVYRCEHIHSGEQAAVKVLRNDTVKPDEAKQFLREVETLKRVRHLHIVPGLDSGKQNGVDYLVMEYAPKGSLKDAYPRPNDKDSLWSLEQVVSMVNDLASALRYLHDNENSLHLDLKPDNVLRGADGQLLLSDFGLVKELDSRSIAMGESCGYSPPEQFLGMGRGKLSSASDQYSLAAMAYEAFTGQRPFFMTCGGDGECPPSLVGKIDGISEEVQKNIQDAIFKALAYNPDDRYENVKIFAEALEKACFGRIRWERRFLQPHQQNLLHEIEKYQEDIRINPRNADAHYNMGLKLYELKRDDEAVEAFIKAIDNKLDDALVYHHKGLALYRLNRCDEALQACKDALDKNPELVNTHIVKGNVLRDLNRSEEAEAAYGNAIDLYTEMVEEYNNKGNELCEREKTMRHRKLLKMLLVSSHGLLVLTSVRV